MVCKAVPAPSQGARGLVCACLFVGPLARPWLPVCVHFVCLFAHLSVRYFVLDYLSVCLCAIVRRRECLCVSVLAWSSPQTLQERLYQVAAPPSLQGLTTARHIFQGRACFFSSGWGCSVLWGGDGMSHCTPGEGHHWGGKIGMVGAQCGVGVTGEMGRAAWQALRARLRLKEVLGRCRFTGMGSGGGLTTPDTGPSASQAAERGGPR